MIEPRAIHRANPNLTLTSISHSLLYYICCSDRPTDRLLKAR